MTENNFIIKQDFVKALKQVIKKKDKVIVIYSGLWSFIFNIKFKEKNIARELLNLIEAFITPNRTLIFPAYSGEYFSKFKKFDIKKSLDRNGLLPKEALKKNYYRTPQPLHSYLIWGKEVGKVKELQFLTSWGRGIFEWLSKKNARICTLGVPWNIACSYFHRYEELYQVPWRYFKIFQGPLYKNNRRIGNCYENKYTRFIKLKYDLSPIVKEISKKKLFLKSNNKKFFLESITTNQIDNVCKNFFKHKAWSIVKNQQETLRWIKKDRLK